MHTQTPGLASELTTWRGRQNGPSEGSQDEWQPGPECGEWHPFDRGTFCSLLRRLGGPLMVVGDAVSRDFLQSIDDNLQLNESRPRDFLLNPSALQTVGSEWQNGPSSEPMQEPARLPAPHLHGQERPPDTSRGPSFRLQWQLLPAMGHSH